MFRPKYHGATAATNLSLSSKARLLPCLIFLPFPRDNPPPPLLPPKEFVLRRARFLLPLKFLAVPRPPTSVNLLRSTLLESAPYRGTVKAGSRAGWADRARPFKTEELTITNTLTEIPVREGASVAAEVVAAAEAAVLQRRSTRDVKPESPSSTSPLMEAAAESRITRDRLFIPPTTRDRISTRQMI